MEETKITQCHTCLGSIETPRNLSEDTYKKLLGILNRLLEPEALVNLRPTVICVNCEGKLIWISEFKETCQKSITTVKNSICKQEFADDESDTYVPNSNLYCITKYSEDSDSDNETLSNLSKIEQEKQKKEKLEKPKPVQRKRAKHKQYSMKDVVQAIADCRSVFTEIKRRTCLHCHYVGSTAHMLSIHMTKNHSNLLPTWCNRCNIHIDNLAEHVEMTKCSANLCKFCNKKNGSIHLLTVHLRTHCRSSKTEDFELIQSGDSVIQPDSLEPEVENDSYTNNIQEKDVPVKKCIKKDRLEQFPLEEVERAVKETMRSFHTMRECIICGSKKKNSMVLSLHMTQMHKKTKDKWCLSCNIMVDDLLEHKKIHLDDIYKCTFCDHNFKNNSLLKVHLGLHCHSSGLKIDSSWFCCKYCPKSFIDKQELKQHKCKAKTKRAKSKDTDSDSDSHCVKEGRGSRKSRLKQFSAQEVQDALIESMKSFYANRKCVTCGFFGSNLSTLGTHMSKDHRKLMHKWCTKCNTLVDNLEDHKESHKKDVLKCKFCEKSFNRTINLKLHLKYHCSSHALDTEPKWFSCKKCPNSYPLEQQLKDHDCKGPDPETFTNRKLNRTKICSICNKSVLNKKTHMKEKHKNSTGPSTKLCPHCGKIFLRSFNLQSHIRTHTGELPYKCSFCEKRFNIRRGLMVHERRHLGEKRHICSVCGKAFVTSVELKRHSETHENGSEQCSICDKKFSGTSSLKLHMKKHRVLAEFRPTPREFRPTPVNVNVQEAPHPQMEIATLIRNPADPFQQFLADMC